MRGSVSWFVRLCLRSFALLLAGGMLYWALWQMTALCALPLEQFTLLSSRLFLWQGEQTVQAPPLSQDSPKEEAAWFLPTQEPTQVELALQAQSNASASQPVTLTLQHSPTTEQKKAKSTGEIVDTTYQAVQNTQHVTLAHGAVRNLSDLSASKIKKLAVAEPPFLLEQTDQPQVLIYHTHATESYQTYDRDWYNLSSSHRSTNNEKNMIAIGQIIAQKLEEAGIGVIHDQSQHDNPSYTGAYDQSRASVQQYLKQYPSIRVVLDVHRDAIQSGNVITAPTTTIDGYDTAQVMLIACADDGSGRLPNYQKNLTFACMLQDQLESDHPTLTRPILFDERFYNQDLSVGALLLEVGGHANTLTEAKNCAQLIGDSLSRLLLELMEQ